MTLDPQIIKETFALAVPIADQVATKFYENLFQDYPAVIPLFSHVDQKKQQSKLINSLVYMVTHLEDSEKLTPFLHNLGSRHTYYGTEEAHYDAVAATLLKTLAFFLGPKWTPKIEQQWTLLLGVIKTKMLEGASQHNAAKKVA